MKILFFLNLDQYKTNQGIVDKAFSQMKFWKQQGHETKMMLLCDSATEKLQLNAFGAVIIRQKQSFPGQHRLMRLGGLLPRHEKQLLKAIVQFQPHVVYHRTMEAGFLLPLAKRFPAVVEINGFQFFHVHHKQHFFAHIQNRLRAAVINPSLRRMLRQHRGAVFVTRELQRKYAEALQDWSFYQKSIVIPNSINVDEFQWRKTSNDADKIKLVFLGTPGLPWHGLPLLLRLAALMPADFEWHIIGENLSDYQLPANIISHGYLSKENYRRVLASCDIGVGTLSLKAAHITEASTLKVREYAAAGLPFFLAYTDTAFLLQPKPQWVLELPTDAEAILQQHERIAAFCRSFKDFVVPAEEVKKYFDFESWEKKRLEFFETICSGSSALHQQHFKPVHS